jgi:L-glyceraldehyde 3-phosphate reductase
MAIAWLLKDTRVTSVLVGASRVSQLQNSIDSMKRLGFSAEELLHIEDILK